MVIHYNVTISSGYFADKLYFMIFPPGETSTSLHVTSPIIYGKAGETLNGQFTTHWDEGVQGTTYRMLMCYIHNNELTQLTNSAKNFTIGQTLTGIDDIANAEGVTITPNPANDIATVKAEQSIKSVIAYSIAGAAAAINATIDGARATLDIAALPAGVYVLRLTLEDSTVVSARLVKR